MKIARIEDKPKRHHENHECAEKGYQFITVLHVSPLERAYSIQNKREYQMGVASVNVFWYNEDIIITFINHMSSQVRSFIIALIIVIVIIGGALFFKKQTNAPTTAPQESALSSPELPSDTLAPTDSAPTPSEDKNENDETASATPTEETLSPPQEKTPPPPAKETAVPPSPPEPTTHQVMSTDSGFSPKTLTIKKGDRVTFTNESASKTWPASAMHPTHTVYPGSSIQKCGTTEASSIFDACRGLASGETYTFTFNEQGNWKYHDHLSPARTGAISVE